MPDMRPGSKPRPGEQGGCTEMLVYLFMLAVVVAVILGLAGAAGSASGLVDLQWLLGEILRRVGEFLP